MKTILIVEDDEDTAKLYTLWLRDKGVVRVAKDGADGCVSIMAVKPDVLIVDLLMPVMDGFTFLRTVKNDARFKDIPVVLTTGAFVGLGHDKDAAELKKVVDSFLFKPVLRKDLTEAVEKLLSGQTTQKLS